MSSRAYDLERDPLTLSLDCTDGAALFFTSHSRPTSFAKLRSYVIHHLFSPPIATAVSTTNGVASLVSTSTIPTSSSSQFPFPYRANVVDRDQVLIPSGWDSWGKIRILRERFDADAAGKGWELDMDRMRARAQDDEEGIDSEGRKVSSTVESYGQIIVDLDADDQASFDPAVSLPLLKADFCFAT